MLKFLSVIILTFELTGSYEGEQALPEPRIIKKNILYSREIAKEKMNNLIRRKSVIDFEEYQSALLSFFENVWVYIKSVEITSGESFHKLNELHDRIITATLHFENTQKEIRKWIQYWFDLDYLLYKSGITAIGLPMRKYEFGYEFLGGLPFDMKVRDNGWLRLRLNCENMKRLLRNDVDLLGIIWGGNRVGKTTLSLHIAKIINPTPLEQKNIVVTDKDFWDAVNTLPKYSCIHIDELSDHFYSKNVMRKDQKLKKRKLKKYAMRNMCIVGCDLNLYNIDKEVLSDKLAFAIRVTKRGHFEFFNKEKIMEFKKDQKTGEVITPSPVFSGNFPKLSDDVWNMYKKVEKKKLELKEMKKEKDKKDKEPTKRELIIKEYKKHPNMLLRKVAKKYNTSISYVKECKAELK